MRTLKRLAIVASLTFIALVTLYALLGVAGGASSGSWHGTSPETLTLYRGR